MAFVEIVPVNAHSSAMAYMCGTNNNLSPNARATAHGTYSYTVQGMRNSYNYGDASHCCMCDASGMFCFLSTIRLVFLYFYVFFSTF